LEEDEDICLDDEMEVEGEVSWIGVVVVRALFAMGRGWS